MSQAPHYNNEPHQAQRWQKNFASSPKKVKTTESPPPNPPPRIHLDHPPFTPPTGKMSPGEGYEGFVDVSRRVMAGRTPVEQRAVVAKVLLSLLPPNGPATVRLLSSKPKVFHVDYLVFEKDNA